MTDNDLMSNPLLTEWQTPFGLPPFDKIKSEHYLPALREAMQQHQAEIDAIANNPDAPTFENTIIAMETAGTLLNRVQSVFSALCMADASEILQATQLEIAPELAAHSNSVMLNEALFKRIDTIYSARAILSAPAKRVVERYHHNFVESGAKLALDAKQRVRAITMRLSELVSMFGSNALAEQDDYELVLNAPGDLEGLPASVIAAAAETGKAQGKPGQHVITLHGSNSGSFMTYSPHRHLREALQTAIRNRGDRDNAHDNKAIVLEIVKLRGQLAREMGYKTYSDYILADRMAKAPAAVHRLMDELWAYALPAMITEKAELEALARELGQNEAFEDCDWAFYANILRKRLLDYDAEETKQYLSIDRVIAAAFKTASRLFGLQFKPAQTAGLYHPDVRAWEVVNADGTHRALFFGDYYARPSKQSGAWMDGFQTYNALTGKKPIAYNVCNFNKPAAGEPCLLSFLDAETIFHEFGHALHDILSQAPYPTLGGRNVRHDFVELPSQVFEHWLPTDAILDEFALHHKTGAPMPQALREKIRKVQKFRQGNGTANIIAATKLDLAWHDLPAETDITDLRAFERDFARKLEWPDERLRIRSTNFGHLFEPYAEAYAAGYYGYLWAQVLDADAFEAFTETGDVFDRETAQKLHDYIYAAGDSEDPAELYRKFRGRDAGTEPLLRNFGFLADTDSQTSAQNHAKAAT